MRVHLAAQILSYGHDSTHTCTLYGLALTIPLLSIQISQIISHTGSVSKVLQLTGGDEARETAHFASMMDKLFDSFIVHSYVLRIHYRKKFQMPYTSGDDMCR